MFFCVIYTIFCFNLFKKLSNKIITLIFFVLAPVVMILLLVAEVIHRSPP